MAKPEKISSLTVRIRPYTIGFLAVVLVTVTLTAILAGPAFLRRLQLVAATTPVPSAFLQIPTLTPSVTLNPSATELPTLLSKQPDLQPTTPNQNKTGFAFLSIDEAGYSHLFAFSPESMTLTRLTMGVWQDITPALSPSGEYLAFASNRKGAWDLYALNLRDGQIIQITDTPEYDANPSWSSDGLWLVYETYIGDENSGNLELYLRPFDGSQEPLRLTDHTAADFSPTWSPSGRVIAFVSTRDGERDIWLANLDQPERMFTNISRDTSAAESKPAWSPDGRKLAWASMAADGIETLVVWDVEHPAEKALAVNSGSIPAWSPTGDALLTSYSTPNQVFLTGYNLENRMPFLPIVALPGEVEGISWGNAMLVPFASAELEAAAVLTPAPLWLARGQNGTAPPGDRSAIVPLAGVQSPMAMLQDGADEAFLTLRERVARAIGWDFLGVLDQAYIPLTSPLEPGSSEDWLFTGRAFQFNTAPLTAGWLLLVREDYGSQTFWRVYLHTRFQNGSMGVPLKNFPWDISARHSGDPIAYEQGGALIKTVPPGYWVDFTRLAGQYGWERVPSLSSWRYAYSSLLYNEYVLREGLDWFSAMLQVYPRSALNTPTRVLSPTPTATFTNTPTPTGIPTSTRYVEPSLTPSLTRQPTLTRTPTLSP